MTSYDLQVAPLTSSTNTTVLFYILISAAAHNKFKSLARAQNHDKSLWLQHSSIHISVGKHLVDNKQLFTASCVKQWNQNKYMLKEDNYYEMLTVG